MKASHSRTSIVYPIILVVLLVLISLSSFVASSNTEGKINSLVDSIIPMNDLADSLLIDLINMETGLRGYELSGDETFLEPYHRGKSKLQIDLAGMTEFGQSYPRLRELMTDKALPLISQMESHYANQINLFDNGQREKALNLVSTGKAYMDSFRLVQQELKDEIDKMATDARQSAHQAELLARLIIGVGGLLALAVGVLSVLIFIRASRAESALRKSEETYRYMAENLEIQNEEIIAQQEEQEVTLEKLSARERELEAISMYQEKLSGSARLEAFLRDSIPALLETLQLDSAMLVLSRAAGERVSGTEDNPAEADEPVFEPVFSIGYPSKLTAVRQSELYGTARRVLEEKRMLESVRQPSEAECGFHQGIDRAVDYYFPLLDEQQESVGFLMLTGYQTTSFEHRARIAQGLIRQFSLAFMVQQANEARNRQTARLEQLNLQLLQEKQLIQEQSDVIGNILQSTHEGMVMCDNRGRIMFANHRMLELSGMEHPVGAPLLDLSRHMLAGSDAGRQALASFEELLAGKLDRFSERFPLASGEQSRYVELYATKVGDSALQQEQGYLFVFRDRTEEEKIDELKNEFISIVSHELRTPLASVLGFIEILLHRQLTPEKQQRYLQTVYKEATRLSTLINDFLDLQRMEAGKQEYRLLPLELGELIREAAGQWSSRQSHTIRLHLPEQEVWVRADADRLMQVAHNLLSNAIKYSPNASQVDVFLEADGDHVRFRVQDYGLGIPEEARDKLFSKFYRVDNSDRRQIGGTGLGLSIVREIVEAHQGTIDFESVMGQGSVFTVTLSAYRGMNPNHGILLLEDDDNLAKLIQVGLQKLQLPTVHLRSAEEGLLALESHPQTPPRLCIVDIGLEGAKSGWDFIAELYRHPKLHRTPVIVSSAMDPPLDYREKEGETYLRKPFSMEKLLQVAEQLLQRSEQRPTYVFPSGDEGLIRSSLARQGIEIDSVTLSADHIQIEPKPQRED
ncbi:Signal transduction histidine kinase [Paenibacillus sp. UNCCL117]|uniref:ATP-binding protein n=1 Tax=unclassified Paenibacillus TaxID=185978 RepID=UPI00088E3F9D|nr:MULTISPECIES: ATP-binding protein [unclassified Paenibacillus]SDD16141.1 Signal transduction histidine kinase [Paenibacillus sp. cl123]SFW34622.1 Signal transduction histidine kinase [Paenibacillus sp. UNCCL117]